MKRAWIMRGVMMNGMKWREEVRYKGRKNQGNEKKKQHKVTNNKHRNEREGVRNKQKKRTKTGKGKHNV